MRAGKEGAEGLTREQATCQTGKERYSIKVSPGNKHSHYLAKLSTASCPGCRHRAIQAIK